MLKAAGVVWLALVSCSAAYPVTQEELAQYVARQQTAGLIAQPQQQQRRQAYLLQPTPQAKTVYQPQQLAPKNQQVIYQQQQQQQGAKQYYTPAAQEPQQYYQPQPQQQVQYQPQYYQPQPAKKLIRPVQGQQLEQEPEDYDPNPHYQFGFDIKDDEFTNYQQRKEQREGDKISGSYSVVDSDGYIRTVKYTADPLEGFKADVVREPTDIKVRIPQPQPQHQLQQAEYSGIAAAARKQQTQQYLQASKPQQVLRPEHTQVYSQSQGQLRQLAAYTGAQQVQVAPQRPLQYSQQPQVYQSYQQEQ